MLTDYELGVSRLISVKAHLFLDTVFAFAMFSLPLLLAMSPELRVFSYTIVALALALTVATRTHTFD